MTKTIKDRIEFLRPVAQRGLFSQIKRGLEKEGLRTTPASNLAQTDHPKALGSTLTHPYITTDYSEALLEFITPVSSKLNETLDFLKDLHAFSYRHLGDEVIWPASMPCKLQGNESIPIARYGSSNSGTMKT
ncbi:MAG: glutamate--cysteine ligase, partial [Oceanospirillum sp.]|nr:glutamate--cysteine ligase [Oceanospirillum sp.]